MHKNISISQGSRILLTMAAFVVIVAGVREARELLVPFLLSAFIAIIAAPPLFYLQRKKIPAGLALALVIGAVIIAAMLFGVLVGNSIDNFSAQLPFYQERLNGQTQALLAWLADMGISIPQQTASKLMDPAKAMRMAAVGLSSLGGLLTNTFLILLTVIFILLEASSFPTKLGLVLQNPDTGMPRFRSFLDNINHYMAIKSATSALTGILVFLWLWTIGVDYPVLWGTLAFLLNFVPNIGSIIASVPALLLALIQLGVGGALWSLLGYVVINVVMGNLIEPRFMGRGLGISTLVVFISLVFWGWILGPVGMFLSVPLTMMIKISLDSSSETRWIAILLGSEVEKT
ncbi:MAG: AI-2E family transporter [Gammaproteobacteria bacterium]|nr:AI-2E family transporter [Gammaproteobacteria bacterium]